MTTWSTIAVTLTGDERATRRILRLPIMRHWPPSAEAVIACTDYRCRALDAEYPQLESAIVLRYQSAAGSCRPVIFRVGCVEPEILCRLRAAI